MAHSTKLFLHVGPAKTGTSAVQHVLQAHDGSVVLYPKVGLWMDGSHHNLVFNFFGDYRRGEVVRGDPAAMLAEIGAQARDRGRNVVISSEALPGRDIRAFADALLPHLGLDATAVEIIVVCREHFSRAASLYNQNVKDAFHLERRSPGDYLRESSGHACYAPMLRRLFSSGLTVKAMNYHPASSFVPRFLEHVGFPANYPVMNESRNVSLSVRGMIALLAANTLGESPEQSKRMRAAMQGLKQRFLPSGFIFDAAAAAVAETVFAADRVVLNRRWGVTLPAPDLTRQTDSFFLTPADIADLDRVCRPLGAEGDAIMGFARRYARGWPHRYFVAISE